ncbi:MAG: Gfo/Idh/MocA family oxidoreductase [Gammaproteobacteria bacterium]|nr:Gfo/Idh/MocA family oxidoreductase [Gammaproteobacteria bacterium]
MRLLILGTGGMANTHASSFKSIKGVDVIAGVDTNSENLGSFCDKYDIKHRFESLEAALEWGEFDAACNVTPDRIHHPTTLPLLAAKKHVLCEKPLADNYPAAQEMAAAAKQSGVVNMVNLSYRNVGVLHQVKEIVANGEIGDIRHFEASYLQSWLTQPAWGDWKTEEQWLWRLSTAHGSLGVLGDVGVHILDLATYAAGKDATDVSCRLKTFHKAKDDKIGPYPLDANDSFAMHLSLGDTCAGVIHASRFASGHLNDLKLRLYGTQGGIELIHSNGEDSLRMCTGEDLQSAKWRNIEPKPIESLYKQFAQAIAQGTNVQPSFERGAKLQRVIDLAMDSNEQNCTSLSI